ncbi:hypothetical protein JCM6882_001153 [Rhodosporidiobolus microsporus]
MGLSMAVDLGVHVDGLRVAADGQDSLETEVRRRLFWSCYVVVEDVLLELYASKRRTKRDADMLERLNKKLETWFDNLDRDFLIATDAEVSPPPNRITLSMLYQATTILVNRPFSFEGWGPRVRVEEEIRNRAKERCRSAANEIVRLLELYDSTFGFRNMNWLMNYCVFQSATILTVDLQAAAPGVAAGASRRVEVILAALTSQSNVTPGVQRAIELVRHLKDHAPPGSGTVTPHKRARINDLLPGGDALGALEEAFAPWQAPLDPLNSGTAATLLPDLPADSLLLPEFPEVGPLAWPGGAGNDFDWLGTLDWLRSGETGV